MLRDHALVCGLQQSPVTPLHHNGLFPNVADYFNVRVTVSSEVQALYYLNQFHGRDWIEELYQ